MSMIAVGSYTHHKSPDIDARGAGVSLVDRNDTTGICRILSRFDGLRNPTYLHWDTASRRLYSVVETGEGRGGVAVFKVSRPEEETPCALSFLGSREGEGRPGCHLTYLPLMDRIFVTSYSDGRLTGYPVLQGLPGPLNLNFQYAGSGPVSGRQDSAHAHQVMKSPHGDVLYVCDLGSDRIWMHRLNNPEARPVPALTVPGGYGPRHLAFDPISPVAYILCELVPRILVAEIDISTGVLGITGELDTVEADRMTMAAPAAVKIHPSGNTVAVSNRFDDTIAVFRILRGGSSGGGESVVSLQLSERFDCRGKTPRDICFTSDGRSLLIANQDSHSITCRHFDPESGIPADDSWGPSLETGTPVCVLALD